MEGLIIAALDDSVLTDKGATLHGIHGGRVYRRGMLGREGVPAQPDNPYLMWGWDGHFPYDGLQDTAPGVARGTLRIYGYDTPASYARIKQMHRLVRETMVGLIGQVEPGTGIHVTGCEWGGLGGDQYDQVRRCNVKVATYRVTARV